jgi:hypothetical protein
MACSDSDPLQVMPPTIAPELPPSGVGFELSKLLVINPTSSEWTIGVFSKLDAEHKRVSPAATVGLNR